MDNDSKRVLLLDILVGQPESLTLSNRILNAATLCSTLITGLILSVALLQRMSMEAVGVTIVGVIVFGSLFALARNSWHPTLLVWVYLGGNYGIVLADWTYIGGTSGIGLAVAVVLTGLLPILLPRSQLLLGFLATAVLFVILFVLGIRVGDMFPEHPVTPLHLSDVLTEGFILAMGFALMTGLVQGSLKRKDKEIQILRGILPICAFCKKVRNDEGLYEAVESYVRRYTEVDFSHTYCPECMEEHYPDVAREMREQERRDP